VAQAFEKVKEEQQDILPSLKIFEGKFEVVCSIVFVSKIIATKVPEEDGKGKTKDGSNNSTRMQENSIKVDMDPRQPKQARVETKDVDLVLEVDVKETPPPQAFGYRV